MAPVSEVGDDAASAVQEGLIASLFSAKYTLCFLNNQLLFSDWSFCVGTRGSRRSKRAKKESRAGSALEKLR